MLTAVLPAAVWYLWVRVTLMHTPGIRTSREVARWAFRQSGYGIVLRMMKPVDYASARLFWLDLYSWPRAFTPRFAALAFGAAGGVRRWLLVPMAAVTLRVGLQFGPQIEGVLRALR